MRKFLLSLPVLLNIIAAWGYKFLSFYVLEDWIGGDHILCEGQEIYRFGIERLSVLAIFILMAVTVAVIWRLGSLIENKNRRKIYSIVAIGLVVLSNGLWIWHYLDYYPFDWFYRG